MTYRFFNYRIFIFIILLLLTGCQAPLEPIALTDSWNNSKYTITVSTNTTNLPLSEKEIILEKTNANDTANYLYITHILADYERDRFEKRKKNLSLEGTLLKNNLLSDQFIQLSISTLQKDSRTTDYILYINYDTMSGYIIGKDHYVAIGTPTINTLLSSDLLPIEEETMTLPDVHFLYKEETINTDIDGTWNKSLYKGRLETKKFYTYNQGESVHITTMSALHIDLSNNKEDIERPTTIHVNYFRLPGENSPITFQPKSTDLVDQFQLSSEPMDQEANISIPLPETAGSYYVETTCTWNTPDSKEFGQIVYHFFIDMEIKEHYSFNQSSYQPGDLIVVTGKNIDPDLNYSIETDLYNQGITFKPYGDNYYLLIPLMSKTQVGEYSLTITDNDHPEASESFKILVRNKEFEVQNLETSESTASLRNNDNYDQLNEAFARGRSHLHDTPLWDGPFLQPVGGRISTEYGLIRYTNGSSSGSRHSGIDFANPEGTKVIASQNGYISLAEYINITGNTLFIDHGFGIISQYYHLNAIYVSLGDYVHAGDVIAEVGTTGFSTGPHLHYAIYNNGIYLNPWKFFETPPF